MPRPEIYGETIYLRVPKGTKAAIADLCVADERQADFLRRLLLEALEHERKKKSREKGNSQGRGKPIG